MKRNIQWIFGMIAALLLLQCDRAPEYSLKQAEEENASLGIQIALPQPAAGDTLIILEHREPVSQWADLFQQEIERSLSENTSLTLIWRTLAPDSSSHAILTVDSTLAGIHFKVEKGGETAWEKSVPANALAFAAEKEAVVHQILTEMGQEADIQTTAAPQMDATSLQSRQNLQGNRQALNRAIQNYQDLLKQDSTYVPAWLGLADAYLSIAASGDPRPVWKNLAQTAVFSALKYAPQNAEAHTRLGTLRMAWGDFQQAETAFLKALDIDANQVNAWLGLGRIYNRFGLYPEALFAYHQVLNHRPSNQESAVSAGLLHMGLKQYDRATEVLETIITRVPELPSNYIFLALAYSCQNRLVDARAAIQKAVAMGDLSTMGYAVAGMIDAKEGKQNDALAKVELEVVPRLENDPGLAVAAAAVYALIGRRGQAITWLENALALGYTDYPWLVNDPHFAPIRDEARFKDILTRLKTLWRQRKEEYLGAVS